MVSRIFGINPRRPPFGSHDVISTSSDHVTDLKVPYALKVSLSRWGEGGSVPCPRRPKKPVLQRYFFLVGRGGWGI